MAKKIMILGASILQLPAILKAKEMGLYVIAVDIDMKAIGFDYADEKCVISTTDKIGVLNIAKKYKPNGIMTLATDMPIQTIAYVSEKIGLSSLSLENAIKASNKAEMRKCLKANNIPIPKYYLANTFGQYLKAIDKIDRRFIVKPVDNSGSRGVSLVEDKRQIELAFKHSKANSHNGLIIIEDYMEGPEVSVETITINGVSDVIAITDKLTTGAPHFVEMGHSIQTRFHQKIRDEIEQVTKATISAIGIINGSSHTEVKITTKGPKIVEIGARLGGDYIASHLVPLATGIDMVGASIKIAIGETFTLKKRLNKSAAIRYMNSGRGIITHISLDDALTIEGVKEIKIFKMVGDYCNEILSSSDRIGCVITQAEAVNHAISICEEALKKIEIVISNG